MRTDTWRELLSAEMQNRKDTVVLSTTLTNEELDTPFNSGYGTSEGKPFTAWSKKYVYFPVVYDGAEWVGSAPRNPCGEATDHVGGQ